MTIENYDFYIKQLGQTAKRAAKTLATINTSKKNYWLIETARLLTENHSSILQANALDRTAALAKQYDAAFIDRLTLTTKSLHAMASQLETLAALPDPVGTISGLSNQDSGIQVGKMRMPIGVILMIYESRPNVTIEAAALAIKAGNSIILRGGSEAIHTNTALTEILSQAAINQSLPAGAAQLVDILDREVVQRLLQAANFVDVIIPRGGKSLVQLVQDHAKAPVIKHLDGICHTYIDKDADLNKAVAIADNAKTQRLGTCNTMETLLVHAAIAEALFSKLLPIYIQKNIELRLCPASEPFAKALGIPYTPAVLADWSTEYLGPILSIKIVADASAAKAHIHHYSSGHTDVIVSENFSTAHDFLRSVDSSSVMVNCSSRFADGFQYGLGGEIGISTNKLHVRGPVGLDALTTEKFIVIGQGQIRR